MDKTVKVVAADNGKAVLFKESTKDGIVIYNHMEDDIIICFS